MKVRIHFSKGFFPLLISSLLVVLCLAGCAENSSILDNGQSRQLKFSVKTYSWNNSNCSSDSKPDSRATPISGNTFDTSKNFNVIADVNKGGSWSTEVDNETASYSSTNKIWQTPVTHYWPGSGSTVNFYAYYPTSILNKITHTSGSAPVLSFTVPDNVADQIDILTSSKTGVAGDSYNQTPVDFKHIFAALQFSVGSEGMGGGTISSISIGDVHNSGTYTFGSGWTLGTAMKAFTISQPKTISGTSGESIYSGTYTLMMIPQTINNATVTITYSNGGTLTKTISGTWEAGEVYNYGLSFIREYNYTGNVQSFTAPVSGTYKLEVWGAQGGGWGDHINPPGGYAGGYKKLTKGDVLYVVVGGKGYDDDHYTDGTSYNGGGTGYISGYGAYGGGGATDIATRSGCLKDLSDFRSSVLIVAGGAGSNGGWAAADINKFESGGGEVGLGSNTVYNYWIDKPQDILSGTTNGDTGGTQTGTGPDGIKGGFGYGGSTGEYAGAGGGGWYGGNASGGGGVSNATNGGGGSGYIGGVDNGTFQTGVRLGNGYARITFISAN